VLVRTAFGTAADGFAAAAANVVVSGDAPPQHAVVTADDDDVVVVVVVVVVVDVASGPVLAIPCRLSIGRYDAINTTANGD